MIILKPSKIEGVGCFTTIPISKGQVADIWFKDDVRVVKKRNVKDKTLYGHYCVETKDEYICPVSFKRMSVGWYINHSNKPNLDSGGTDGIYRAIRDIKAGQELTIDYRLLDDEVNNLKYTYIKLNHI